jgi:hypothetical protein
MNDNGTDLAVLNPPSGGSSLMQPSGAKRSEMIRMNERGIRPETMADLWIVAQRISISGLAPKGMERPETIFVALEMGMELGLPLMSALRNIAVINGRPAIWGDAALALVQSTGLLEDYEEHVDGEGDAMIGVVISKRRGRSKPIKTTFSVSDAKKVGLWGKQGPWSQYAPRMLKLRARGFNLRDNFPDVLQGLYTAEEAGDIPTSPVTQISAVPNPLNKLNAKLGQVNTDTGELTTPEPATDTPSTPAPNETGESMTDPPQPAEVKVDVAIPADADAFTLLVCETLGIGEQDALKLIKLKLAKPWDKLRTSDRRQAVEDLRAGKWAS